MKNKVDEWKKNEQDRTDLDDIVLIGNILWVVEDDLLLIKIVFIIKLYGAFDQINVDHAGPQVVPGHPNERLYFS